VRFSSCHFIRLVRFARSSSLDNRKYRIDFVVSAFSWPFWRRGKIRIPRAFGVLSGVDPLLLEFSLALILNELTAYIIQFIYICFCFRIIPRFSAAVE